MVVVLAVFALTGAATVAVVLLPGLAGRAVARQRKGLHDADD